MFSTLAFSFAGVRTMRAPAATSLKRTVRRPLTTAADPSPIALDPDAEGMRLACRDVARLVAQGVRAGRDCALMPDLPGTWRGTL